MKLKAIFYSVLLSLSATAVKAQTEIPAGYTKGSITLANGTVVAGYLKDNIKKSASVIYVDNAGANKKTYEGSEINSVTMEAENFTCIKGDFFKAICTGKICFLQKASNAANKASYNGAEPVFNSGTEGKIGDYFAYSNNQLIHLTKKSLNNFINEQLGSNAAAVEKAKAANGDIALLADAVTVYNNASK